MMDRDLTDRIVAAVDTDRLVATATGLVGIRSPTGEEAQAAEYLADDMRACGLDVTVQQVEEGRANAVGRLHGASSGPSLMLNGHLDTSYSGDEPWLTAVGFKPEAVIRDDVIFGLGIMNMKGAVACYVEAARALIDAGVRLSGDLVIAGVAGEIEKTQWGEEFIGRDYRGYGTGTRHLVTHGVLTDACILGEPTEERLVIGHWGAMWARISTRGPFVHTAFTVGRGEENSIVRMRDVLDAVLEWVPTWEERSAYRGRQGVVNLGCIRGGFPWRVSRTAHRTDLFLDLRVPPTMSMLRATRAFDELVGSLRERFPEHGIESEVFLTSPGAEIDSDHPIVDAIDAGHGHVHGSSPQRDFVRWGSDASTLTRYGIASVNYGPISSGLPGPEGETVPISSLVNTAATYALAAATYCGVAVETESGDNS